MHNIYRFFTRTHKIIWLSYCLRATIAKSTFLVVLCVFKLKCFVADYLVRKTFFDHLQDFTKELERISVDWRKFLKKFFSFGRGVITTVCHAVDREFDFRLGKVNSAFHTFRIDEITTKPAWEPNTGRLALGWLPVRDICYIATRGLGSCKRVGCSRPLSFMNC